jgi:hypothetical protein
MKQKLRDLLTGTTTIVMTSEDIWDTGHPFDIATLKCCEIGPVLDDTRYCSKCGKRIIRK